jgi:hypothetical protein
MRLLIFLLATCFASSGVHAEGIDMDIGIRLAQGAGPAPATPSGPFTFTVPQSRVIVKVSDASLRPDDAANAKPNYFKLMRREPQLILSGWLEPAARYKGFDAFRQAESRSPAFAAPFAPSASRPERGSTCTSPRPRHGRLQLCVRSRWPRSAASRS